MESRQVPSQRGYSRQCSRTQVTVNSEGKTNEATKQVNEPLKQGQTEPTAGQEQKEEEKKRSKGMKM